MLLKLKNKKDLVFVGGFAMHKHGLKKQFADYDIVVRTLDGLGKVFTYETDSVFSGTGKRGFMVEDDCKVDIFIEDKLPDYLIIDGCKVQTIDSMRKYYEGIKTDNPHWCAHIAERLNILK